MEKVLKVILFVLGTVVKASDSETVSPDVPKSAEFVLDVRKNIESCSPSMSLPRMDSCNINPKLSLDGEHLSLTFNDLCSCLMLLKYEANLTSTTTSSKVAYKREVKSETLNITDGELNATASFNVTVTESSLSVTSAPTELEEEATELVLTRTVLAGEKTKTTLEPEETKKTATADTIMGFITVKGRFATTSLKLPYTDLEKNATVLSESENYEDKTTTVPIVLPSKHKEIFNSTELLTPIKFENETSSTILATLAKLVNVTTKSVVYVDTTTYTSAPIVEKDRSLAPKETDYRVKTNSTEYVTMVPIYTGIEFSDGEVRHYGDIDEKKRSSEEDFSDVPEDMYAKCRNLMEIGNYSDLSLILVCLEKIKTNSTTTMDWSGEENPVMYDIPEIDDSGNFTMFLATTFKDNDESKEFMPTTKPNIDDRDEVASIPNTTSFNSETYTISSRINDSHIAKMNAYILIIMALSLALVIFWVSCLLCRLFRKRGSYSVQPCEESVEIGVVYRNTGNAPT